MRLLRVQLSDAGKEGFVMAATPRDTESAPTSPVEPPAMVVVDLPHDFDVEAEDTAIEEAQALDPTMEDEREAGREDSESDDDVLDDDGPLVSLFPSARRP